MPQKNSQKKNFLPALKKFLSETEDLVIEQAKQAGAKSAPKTSDFVVYLIEKISGHKIEGIAPEAQGKVVKDIVQIYLDFLEEYLLQHKGKKVYDKFKEASIKGDTLISKRDPEIKTAIQEAHKQFLAIADQRSDVQQAVAQI